MWIWITLAALVLVGAFILAAARRKGPDIEQAFVDAESEAEAEARDVAAGVPIDFAHPGASIEEARAAARRALDADLNKKPDAGRKPTA